jgi:hypothetical protein
VFVFLPRQFEFNVLFDGMRVGSDDRAAVDEQGWSAGDL